MLGKDSLLEVILGQHIDPPRLQEALSSIFQTHPEIRGAVLNGLLLPSTASNYFQFSPPAQGDYSNLADSVKMTPFERMSLLAKRFAFYNDHDRTLKAQQLDIIGTIRWLEEVLK